MILLYNIYIMILYDLCVGIISLNFERSIYMDADPDHNKNISLSTDTISISVALCKKLVNILSAESTLISTGTNEMLHVPCKLHLLPNAIDYYRDINRIIQKAFKSHGHLDQYRRYKQHIHLLNCIGIIQNTDGCFIRLHKKSAKGFMNIYEHPLEN